MDLICQKETDYIFWVYSRKTSVVDIQKKHFTFKHGQDIEEDPLH